ncbi:hypothetical protein BC834DRAFT_973546 [Gloeopeniophorella convolvens]|nr:hypothetical protein BC834DRAFT_973546 [Gloeopeniophorella convolvens]
MPDDTQNADTARQLHINYILNIFPLVILYYDFAITLSKEVEFFWPPKRRLGYVSFFFLLNRYLLVIGTIPSGLSFVINGGKTCVYTSRHEFHEGITIGVVGILCIIRVYALCDRSRRVLTFFILLYVAAFAVSVYGIVAPNDELVLSGLEGIVPGCPPRILVREGHKRFMISWISVLLFDSAIFGFTVLNTILMGKGARLHRLLFRDGALYFAFVLGGAPSPAQP